VAERPLQVGLLGCGVVGSAVAERIVRRQEDLSFQVGAPVKLAAIAVRQATKGRSPLLPPELFTNDAMAVAVDHDLDLLIEVIGGVDDAGRYLVAALGSGKSVVTANKQLLARHGPALERQARRDGVELRFEAAVGGAMPVVRMLRESLAGERVHRLVGILNGTTNYILTQMGEHGWGFSRALLEAQRAGYAEADPTDDLSGSDAAAKAVILSRIAFRRPVALSEVRCRGIDEGIETMVAHARERGAVVRLLVVAEDYGRGVSVVVEPRILDPDHQLAGIVGARNAIVVEGEASGPLLLTGAGAGGVPTASAVLGDVVCALRAVVAKRAGPRPLSSVIPRLPSRHATGALVATETAGRPQS
jgi:homoserine dehydrogenase